MGSRKIINDKTSVIRKRPRRPPPPASPPPVTDNVEYVTNLVYDEVVQSGISGQPLTYTDRGEIHYDPMTQQLHIVDHNGDRCILATDCFGFDHAGGDMSVSDYNTVMGLHQFIQNLKDNEEENEKVAKMSVEGAGKLRTGIIKNKPIRINVDKDQPEGDRRDDLGPEDRARLDTETHNCELEEELTCMKLHEEREVGGNSNHTVTKVLGGFIYCKIHRSMNGESICSTFVPCKEWHKDGSIYMYPE